ncbi:hypothetical protein K227x_22440 [Rubripirellula lacrimiformis]|uniref:Uncharacterized protein n=2 Tax=Rubripirellula lacrimiformis TaxID=1930273 RepID=A0A517N9P8_9BACT|nr:hypothetical protein K227x_22440 [Rubripirellula lacrimiformis]
MDESIRRTNTPIQISIVSGLGELRQFADRWEVQLAPPPPSSHFQSRPITIDSPWDGPTEKQLELVRQLPPKYEEIEWQIREKLRQYFDEMGSPEEYDTVDFGRMTAHVLLPGDETELEIQYSSIEEHSDMGYSVCLSDWKVMDVYGGD